VAEAIAVSQVMGNTPNLTADLFQPGETLAGQIANQYQGATTNIQIASLFYLGLILLVMSLIVNFSAQVIVRRFAIERAH